MTWMENSVLPRWTLPLFKSALNYPWIPLLDHEAWSVEPLADGYVIYALYFISNSMLMSNKEHLKCFPFRLNFFIWWQKLIIHQLEGPENWLFLCKYEAKYELWCSIFPQICIQSESKVTTISFPWLLILTKSITFAFDNSYKIHWPCLGVGGSGQTFSYITSDMRPVPPGKYWLHSSEKSANIKLVTLHLILESGD